MKEFIFLFARKIIVREGVIMVYFKFGYTLMATLILFSRL